MSSQNEINAINAAWPLYFPPSQTFTSTDHRVKLILALAKFFRYQGAHLLTEVDIIRQSVVSLNYDDFISKCPLRDLSEAISDEPEEILACLGLALCVLRAEKVPSNVPPRRILVRMQNVHPLTPVRQLKSNSIGKFVSLRGNVVRVSGVRPLVVRMRFECLRCGTDMMCEFVDGKYEPPSKCDNTQCRSRSFSPLRESAITVDWQQIKLQEIESDLAEPGRIPRTIDCELTHDLVDRCVPGDVITIAGIVKSMNTDVAQGRSASRARNLFSLYLDVNSVATQKLAEESIDVTSSDATDSNFATSNTYFSEKELKAIVTIASHENPFALVVASMCPSIFGNELIKAGLVLGLFGGSRKRSETQSENNSSPRNDEQEDTIDLTNVPGSPQQDDTEGSPLRSEPLMFEPTGPVISANGLSSQNRMSVRCDPHILIVGDPGLGKSQMLRAASLLAPRGVYVCGNTTSTTGLTVTMMRDPVSGEYGLEAGALVLSDQGICCIDEFDKMSADHQALLEAMEQQRISTAKAGIVCSLSARTTVLAAANPVGGHYDRCKTIAENLKMLPALLSRFDIIFIMIDTPDRQRDMELSRHVMTLHATPKHQRHDVLQSKRKKVNKQFLSQSSSHGTDLISQRLSAFSQASMSQESGIGDLSFHMGDDEEASFQQTGLFMSPSQRKALQLTQARLAAADTRINQGQIASRQFRHSNTSNSISGTFEAGSNDGFSQTSTHCEEPSFAHRLRSSVLKITDPIPLPLLRKYIAYARRFCDPVLSAPAARVLQRFYLELRHQHASEESTPITTRQLESLIRLAQARAKVDMRTLVREQDATEVVELMREALLDAATDAFGVVDFSRSASGGMSMSKQVKAFVKVLNAAAARKRSSIFTRDEMEGLSRDMGLNLQIAGGFSEFIDILNQQNYILKKGARLFQLLASTYSRY